MLVVFILCNWNSNIDSFEFNLQLNKFFYGICSLMGERMVVVSEVVFTPLQFFIEKEKRKFRETRVRFPPYALELKGGF